MLLLPAVRCDTVGAVVGSEVVDSLVASGGYHAKAAPAQDAGAARIQGAVAGGPFVDRAPGYVMTQHGVRVSGQPHQSPRRLRLMSVQRAGALDLAHVVRGPLCWAPGSDDDLARWWSPSVAPLGSPVR